MGYTKRRHKKFVKVSFVVRKWVLNYYHMAFFIFDLPCEKCLTKNTCRLYKILVTKELISPTFPQDFGFESFPPLLNLRLFPGHRKDKLSGRVKMAKSWFKPEIPKNLARINRKLNNVCIRVLSRGLVTKIKWPSH